MLKETTYVMSNVSLKGGVEEEEDEEEEGNSSNKAHPACNMQLRYNVLCK